MVLGPEIRNGLGVSLAALAIWSLAVQSSYTQSSTVPAPWSARDIGSPTPAGNSSYDPSGTFSIDAGGADIWGTSDKFHFVYQQVSGDVDVVARVDSTDAGRPMVEVGRDDPCRRSRRIQLMRFPWCRRGRVSPFSAAR